MANVSLTKQFENKIAAIAEIKVLKKVKRTRNRRGNWEMQGDVIFNDHEKNGFNICWDTVTGTMCVFRREFCDNSNGIVTYRSEPFSDEFTRCHITEAEATAFIHEFWDAQKANWH